MRPVTFSAISIWLAAELLLGLAIVGIFAGLMWSFFTPELYRASATIMVEQYRPPSLDYASTTTASNLTATYAQLLQARPVLSATISDLKLGYDLADLSKHVNAKVVRDTQLITLNVDDPSPEVAAMIAQQIITEFQQQDKITQDNRFAPAQAQIASDLAASQASLQSVGAHLVALANITDTNVIAQRSQLESQQAVFQSNVNLLTARLESIQATSVQPLVTTTVVEPPQAGDKPVSPNTLFNAALGLLAGLLLGGGILALRYHINSEASGL